MFVLETFSDGRELLLVTTGWPTYSALRTEVLVFKEIVGMRWWASVIYCITWSLCKMLHIGETGTRLGDRFI